jgi:hypothetical protein
VWLGWTLVVTSALTGAAMAHVPAAASPQVPGIVPSGFGDAVDRDVARVRAATDNFKSSTAAEALGYVRITDFPAWTATEPPRSVPFGDLHSPVGAGVARPRTVW